MMRIKKRWKPVFISSINRKLRRKIKRLFVSKEAQARKLNSVLLVERDAALEELEYLRGQYRKLEARAIHNEVILKKEVRFNFLFDDRLVAKRPEEVTETVVEKQSRGRIVWNGLDDQQAFYLEIECLRRIESNMVSLDGKQHFPRLLSLNPNQLSFSMTNNGTPLDKLKKRVVVPHVKEQIGSIIQTLKKASVVHLDLAGGKNITVNDEGTLCLIDFDIACLDNLPLSSKINARYCEFVENGGYAGFSELLFRVLTDNSKLMLSE